MWLLLSWLLFVAIAAASAIAAAITIKTRKASKWTWTAATTTWPLATPQPLTAALWPPATPSKTRMTSNWNCKWPRPLAQASVVRLNCRRCCCCRKFMSRTLEWFWFGLGLGLDLGFDLGLGFGPRWLKRAFLVIVMAEVEVEMAVEMEMKARARVVRQLGGAPRRRKVPFHRIWTWRLDGRPLETQLSVDWKGAYRTVIAQALSIPLRLIQ